MSHLSYRQLFAFLEDMGFEELCTDRDVGFYHERSHTMFAFSSVDEEEPVCEADLLTVQQQLTESGLITGELIHELESSAVASAIPTPHFLSRPWSNV